MKLNLIIRSDKKYKSDKTGVFVRDSSGIRELQNLDEIKVYYPDFDISQITQEYYKPVDIWTGEISHNLSYLASHIKIGKTNLYYYLWKPSEIGYDFINEKYVKGIKEGLDYLVTNSEISKYDSVENIKSLTNFLQSLYNCLSGLIINHSDEFKLISQR